MDEVRVLKSAILTELIRRQKFGGAHTPLENITRNAPVSFLQNKEGQKRIHKVLKELVNDGWVMVLKKRTGKGSDLHISINPRRIREISEYLAGRFGKAL